jgi:Ca-activated chloride channel family protein
VKARWQPPAGGESRGDEFVVVDAGDDFASASSDDRFAAAVAAFGMVLRQSPHRGQATFDGVLAMAEGAADDDDPRREFVELVRRARDLSGPWR